MPGVHIGHGAIIASGSIVVENAPDDAIVGDKLARLIRRRQTDPEIARLLSLAWWSWPVEHISVHIRTIMVGTVGKLEDAAPMLS
jgi:virginiamycin A acetyltransferase